MACKDGVCDIELPQPCAEVGCYHNMDGYCYLQGYKGPTMEGSCTHFERD